MRKEMMEFCDDSGISCTIRKQPAPCSKQITTQKPHQSSLNLYRQDALPDAQTTVTKH